MLYMDSVCLNTEKAPTLSGFPTGRGLFYLCVLLGKCVPKCVLYTKRALKLYVSTLFFLVRKMGLEPFIILCEN